ncbi:MAG: hypothetical protein OD817_09100, partial [Gammaproteobacteria bacterium]
MQFIDELGVVHEPHRPRGGAKRGRAGGGVKKQIAGGGAAVDRVAAGHAGLDHPPAQNFRYASIKSTIGCVRDIWNLTSNS